MSKWRVGHVEGCKVRVGWDDGTRVVTVNTRKAEVRDAGSHRVGCGGMTTGKVGVMGKGGSTPGKLR